ncbi:ubiquitin carboxyl-terminal hydrolase [Thecamonas trahens ATCC 50062]|uniref:ubiquitinyl hydrolase 1 n=1 Tax=Thecamonas trahens ATCC 50062 TaxID=461836 RepID=A0A0L0D6Y6_THETB|nr:ubiquitin carboxyl-terminal hydrolase [Thecamonas trahens ATCC 50062]KNC48127.1 ubiquitin carboxyl-terminal hydrolase [Thecamonas trahens ATCC 50062]|eukprot:XP_013758698.1 ubiquitin carboxyl-terminal hydrolase [Thecamonas trahens ATCC 50062]
MARRKRKGNKPPPPPAHLAWADSLDRPDQVSQEHVDTAYGLAVEPVCPDASGKNRAHSAYCLHGWAKRGKGVWATRPSILSGFKDNPEELLRIPPPPPPHERFEWVGNTSRRPYKIGKCMVGLANLGATCYMNSLLQTLYMDVPFRAAVYAFDPACVAQTIPPGQTSVVHELQRVFAYLELSQKTVYVPQQLVSALGLDTTEQQDAQEFYKLFLSAIETEMRQSDDPHVASAVGRTFRGKLSYVTTCQSCKHASRRSEPFYELDLNFRSASDKLATLENLITDYVTPEVMDGDNKVFCSKCEGKHAATRAIELEELPSSLVVQVKRFTYDMVTFQKKKIHTNISYPQSLNPGRLVPNADFPAHEYRVWAILEHAGATTSAGHYIAFLREPINQYWYRFNDEEVRCDMNFDDPLDAGADALVAGTDTATETKSKSKSKSKSKPKPKPKSAAKSKPAAKLKSAAKSKAAATAKAKPKAKPKAKAKAPATEAGKKRGRTTSRSRRRTKTAKALDGSRRASSSGVCDMIEEQQEEEEIGSDAVESTSSSRPSRIRRSRRTAAAKARSGTADSKHQMMSVTDINKEIVESQKAVGRSAIVNQAPTLEENTLSRRSSRRKRKRSPSPKSPGPVPDVKPKSKRVANTKTKPTAKAGKAKATKAKATKAKAAKAKAAKAKATKAKATKAKATKVKREPKIVKPAVPPAASVDPLVDAHGSSLERWESKNAYMFVYSRHRDEPLPEYTVPQALREEVEAENTKLLARIYEFKSKVQAAQEQVDTERARYTSLMERNREALKTDPRNVRWLPVAWLRSWALGNRPPLVAEPELLCKHGCIDPQEAPNLKVVHASVYHEMVELYADSASPQFPELNLTSCCIECLRSYVSHRKSLRDDIAHRAAVLTRIDNGELNGDDDAGVYIDKKFLTRFRRSTTSTTYGSGDINEKIMCEHGKLTPSGAVAVKVGSDDFDFMCQYAGVTGTKLTGDAIPCAICAEKYETKKSKRSALASQLKEERILARSFLERRTVAPKEASDGWYFAIPEDFVHDWREYVKHALDGDVERPKAIDTAPLRCEHGKLLYHFSRNDLRESRHINVFDLMAESKWSLFVTKYPCEAPVRLCLAAAENTGDLELVYSPEPCSQGCVEAQLERDRQEDADDTSEIFVRLVGPGENWCDIDVEEERKRILPKTTASGRVRRTRQQTNPIRRFDFHPELTVGELKYDIFRKFNVSDTKQVLFFNNDSLEDNEKPLIDCGVAANNVIICQTSSQPDDDDVAQAIEKKAATVPETGFAGSRLVSSFAPRLSATEEPVVDLVDDDDDDNNNNNK